MKTVADNVKQLLTAAQLLEQYPYARRILVESAQVEIDVLVNELSKPVQEELPF